jgi:hypothetical protein
MNPELGENMLGVMSSGVRADRERKRDLRVRAAFREEHRHLHLARSEAVLQLKVNRTRQFRTSAPIRSLEDRRLHQPRTEEAELVLKAESAAIQRCCDRGKEDTAGSWDSVPLPLNCVSPGSSTMSTPTSFKPEEYSKCTVVRWFTRCPHRPTFIPYAA